MNLDEPCLISSCPLTETKILIFYIVAIFNLVIMQWTCRLAMAVAGAMSAPLFFVFNHHIKINRRQRPHTSTYFPSISVQHFHFLQQQQLRSSYSLFSRPFSSTSSSSIGFIFGCTAFKPCSNSFNNLPAFSTPYIPSRYSFRNSSRISCK